MEIRHVSSSTKSQDVDHDFGKNTVGPTAHASKLKIISTAAGEQDAWPILQYSSPTNPTACLWSLHMCMHRQPRHRSQLMPPTYQVRHNTCQVDFMSCHCYTQLTCVPRGNNSSNHPLCGQPRVQPIRDSLVHPFSAPMARYANLGAPPPSMLFNPSLQPHGTPQGIPFKLRTPLKLGQQAPSTQIFGPSFGAFFGTPQPVHHTP